MVNGAIQASFTPDPIEGYAPLQVNFTNQSSTSLGSSGITSQWFFGNGTTASYTIQTQTSTTYLSPGIYSVTLIVRKGSCMDTITKIIRVEPASQMEVPNIFSPNGDGVNDIFRLRSSSLKTLYVIIFDRWGNRVYEVESDTGNFAWDGKNLKGKDCAEGVYFYVIRGSGKDEKEYEKKGQVTLVR